MVALIVPWRPGDAYREAAWVQLKARHSAAHPTWQIVEGDGTGPDWCKAAAVADALTRTDADVLVVHDADVWTDGLDQAVDAIDDTTRWAIPHGQVYRLAKDQAEETDDRRHLDQNAYLGFGGGGVVILTRATYDACPLDPRFLGWGQEDESWAIALHTMHGDPWRGTAPLWHWWHPPQERTNRFHGSRQGKDLHHRYERAAHDPAAMDRLIKEARHG